MGSKANRPASIRTTDAQIDAAVRASRARKAAAPRIVAAAFDAKRDAIAVTLSNGSEFSVPRNAVAGLAAWKPSEIADLAPQSSGFSVWSKRADTGVRLHSLLEAVAGSSLVSIAAGIIASHSSQARAEAARENGRKGGRPRKAAAEQPRRAISMLNKPVRGKAKRTTATKPVTKKKKARAAA